MADLYAHAHELLNASEVAFDAGSYVSAILIIQDVIHTVMDIVNGIALAATTVQM